MLRQQLGRLEIDSPLEPRFGPAKDSGRLRPAADNTGLTTWFTRGTPQINSRTFKRRTKAWSFPQEFDAYVERPIKRATNLQDKADLASREPTTTIELLLRRLLAEHHVVAARKLAEATPHDYSLNESLRHLLIVLAPPVIYRRLPAQANGSANIEWLLRNAENYTGTWVALANGNLLATDKSLAGLRRKLTDLGPDAEPLLHHL